MIQAEIYKDASILQKNDKPREKSPDPVPRKNRKKTLYSGVSALELGKGANKDGKEKTYSMAMSRKEMEMQGREREDSQTYLRTPDDEDLQQLYGRTPSAKVREIHENTVICNQLTLLSESTGIRKDSQICGSTSHVCLERIL